MHIQCLLKREGGTHVDLCGMTVHFRPNAQGDHVAEVTDEWVIERLLSITEAYQEHIPSDSGHPVEAVNQPAENNRFVISNGEQSIDLKTLNRAELISFGGDHFGLTFHHSTKDDTIRQKIVEAVHQAAQS